MSISLYKARGDSVEFEVQILLPAEQTTQKESRNKWDRKIKDVDEYCLH